MRIEHIDRLVVVFDRELKTVKPQGHGDFGRRSGLGIAQFYNLGGHVLTPMDVALSYRAESGTSTLTPDLSCGERETGAGRAACCMAVIRLTTTSIAAIERIMSGRVVSPSATRPDRAGARIRPAWPR